MSEVIELVNITPAITWGAWEPLALALLDSAAAAGLLAGILALTGKAGRLIRPLLLTGVAGALAGLTALGLSLEQPLRTYQFGTSPHFTTWTTVGAFLAPAFLAACALAAYMECRRGGLKRPFAGLTVLLSLGIFAYTSQEIAHLIGREMWTGGLLPIAFLFAGAAGGVGLTAVFAGPQGRAGDRLLGWVMTLASLGCAAFTYSLSAPAGYHLQDGTQWGLLGVIGLIAALLSLVSIWYRKGLGLAAGLACYAATLAFYGKLLYLGQSIPRLSYTAEDAFAWAQMFSAESMLALAGSLGLLLAVWLIASGVLPANQAANRG